MGAVLCTVWFGHLKAWQPFKTKESSSGQGVLKIRRRFFKGITVTSVTVRHASRKHEKRRQAAFHVGALLLAELAGHAFTTVLVSLS